MAGVNTGRWQPIFNRMVLELGAACLFFSLLVLAWILLLSAAAAVISLAF